MCIFTYPLVRFISRFFWKRSGNRNPGRINSLWPSDAIWRKRPGSTLAQVIACCLTAPSHCGIQLISISPQMPNVSIISLCCKTTHKNFNYIFQYIIHYTGAVSNVFLCYRYVIGTPYDKWYALKKMICPEKNEFCFKEPIFVYIKFKVMKSISHGNVFHKVRQHC